jgi:DNA-binding IclR family transcriptional regulator
MERSTRAYRTGATVSRVQSIQRAFAVLGALSQGPLGVTEIADRVGLPKSTVARLLSALQAEGVVERAADRPLYRIGPRLTALSAAGAPGAGLVAIVRPDLEDLAGAVGEAAGLGIPDGFRVHYVDQADTPNAVQARDWTGTRVPMHAVPSGLVLLAHLPAADLDAFLAQPLERFTPQTVTDPVALRTRLAHVRADGYAWVREEFDVGISSVAAPVLDAGSAVAAIHLHGPSYRFPPPGAEARIATALTNAAARASAKLARAGRGPSAAAGSDPVQ